MVSAVLRDQSSRPRLVTVSEIVGNRRIGPLLANQPKTYIFAMLPPPATVFSDRVKTLKTKPKTSQGNLLYQRLMKQATVSTH
jgi:hypothetical protein